MPITKVSTGLISSEVASTNLNIDDNTLFIDVSTNRVGVGNLVPSTALDVTGTVTADGLRVDGTPVRFVSTSPMLYFMESGATDSNHRLRQNFGNFVIQKLSDDEGTATDRLLIDGGTGDISFYEDTGTSPKFFWDASAESLGIGTTSPSAPLTVQGGTASAATIQLKGGVNGNDNASIHSLYNLKFKADSSEAIAGREISFAVGATDAMTIDSSGNVGIGTSLPTTALTVSTDGTEQLTINRADASINAGNTVGTILFTGDDPSANQTGARIQILAAENWATNAYGSHITFSSDSSGTLTERMRIDADGRVGIGTTPSTDWSANSVLQIGTKASFSSSSSFSGFATNLVATSSGWSVKYTSAGAASAYLQTTSDGSHRFYTAPSGSAGETATLTESMRLDSSGRQLIGYTSSVGTAYQTNLQVKGSSASNYGGLGVISTNNEMLGVVGTWSNGENSLMIAADPDNLRPSSSIVFTTDASERMRISSDGSISTQTLGTNNLRLGANAGNSIVSGGDQNVLVGDEAGTSLTTGDDNVAIGYSSLATEDTGGQSTAVGAQALRLQNNDGANYNTAVGYNAGGAVTTGTFNTLIGGLAGDATTTASSNTAIGYASFSDNITGAENVAVGKEALGANTTASENTAVGHQAGFSTTTGTANAVFGHKAWYGGTGNYNSVFGHTAYRDGGAGNNNAAFGYASMSDNTGNHNSAFGNQSVQQNTSGTNNTGVGSFALFSNTTASNNTAVGYEALLANTTGSNLTAVGRGALDANTTGNLNVAVGTNALGSNTVGDRNVAIGDNALQSFNPASNVDSYNVAVGLNAGISLTTGTDNTFIGGLAGEVMTTGSKNTILGRYNGNQGGLDIRTSSNYIVLSDGDGNPRQFYDATYNTWDLGSSDGIARAELFNAVTVADDSTLTITNSEAGAMLLSVYDTGLGKGALFFATYSGLTSILASSGDFAISDSDGNYCVYKSTSSHTITFKNRTGASRNIAILAIGAKAKKN